LFERTCDALEAGHAVGWFQGRMEFGPRALGGRSILGDPRNPAMQKTLNLKVKYRESFRPFAPSVLREDVADYFELDADSPYMLLVADVKRNRRQVMTPDQEQLFGIDRLNVARSDIPAVTHVDYFARIQAVHAETNPRLLPWVHRGAVLLLDAVLRSERGRPRSHAVDDCCGRFRVRLRVLLCDEADQAVARDRCDARV
jgi:predicted NodU family carbamoyl transferase